MVHTPFQVCHNLLSIDYQPDPYLHTIGPLCGFIFNTKVTSITIPKKVTVLEPGWLELTIWKLWASTIKTQFFFSVSEKKFIFRKSSAEKGNFDVLHFSVGDVKTVSIPRFIEVIGNSAFRNHMSLKKVQIEEGSDRNLHLYEIWV